MQVVGTKQETKNSQLNQRKEEFPQKKNRKMLQVFKCSKGNYSNINFIYWEENLAELFWKQKIYWSKMLM